MKWSWILAVDAPKVELARVGWEEEAAGLGEAALQAAAGVAAVAGEAVVEEPGVGALLLRKPLVLKQNSLGYFLCLRKHKIKYQAAVTKFASVV